MLDKEIDANEYREIKEEYEGEIGKLEREIEKMSTLDSDLKDQIMFCCDFLEKLPKYFTDGDLTAKQQILGSILAEKLVFDENKYRTIKLKSIVSLICRPGKDFKGSRNKKSSENSELSNVVPGTGLHIQYVHERSYNRKTFLSPQAGPASFFICSRLQASLRASK
jgi:hypothetical protein